MRRLFLVVVTALGVLGAAAPASAQSGIAPLVKTQLDSAVVLMRGQGFALQGFFAGGALAQGASETLRVDLQLGASYIIVGVCDGNCSDLDLLLKDAAGTEVDSDYEVDDVPMVAAEGGRDGTYTLTVSMPGCSGGACAFGVAVVANRKAP